MSTLHNRGPPAACQGPRIKINQRTANAAVMPTKCHPSAQRKCYLSPRLLTALVSEVLVQPAISEGQVDWRGFLSVN